MGQGIGLVVAVIAIPVLLRHLGAGAFGLFMIILALVGYSGLLDLGIGRVVTAEVSKHHFSGDTKSIVSCISTALFTLMILAIFLSGTILLFSEHFTNLLIGESQHLFLEGEESMKLLAIAIPVVLLTSGIRGALEGLQEFKSISKINMPMGAAMFAIPAGLSFVSTSVSHLMVGLLSVRIVSLVLFYLSCSRYLNGIKLRAPSWGEISSLVKSGRWMTVSNAISPIMTNLDRLFVSAQISPAAAALYITPYELATKVLLPAGSIANATFPAFAAFSTTNSTSNERLRYFLFSSGLTTIVAIIPAMIMFFFAQDILRLWISEEFSKGVSTDIMRVLSLGIIANAAAYIPFAYVQSIGRSDVTAKFQLLELALYLPSLLYALQVFGVLGAAIIWAARVTLDAMLLYCYALRKI